MVARPVIARLFVYGTLMPGHLRWPTLEPFLGSGPLAIRPAAVAGVLYDSGNGWPVAVFDDGPAGDAHGAQRLKLRTGTVPGVVVDLDPDRLGQAMLVIDVVEDTATDALARIEVVTVSGEVAWAYHHPGPVGDMVRIERWATGFAER